MEPSLLINTNRADYVASIENEGRVETLTNSDSAEVLTFLERRPIHTAYLAGLVRDNGIENPLNRGTFYGYRNQLNQLEGVAVIGHATLMETSSDQAIHAFAQTAQSCHKIHVLMFEENHLDKFWDSYAAADQRMRHAGRQHLLELRWPMDVSRVSNLRPATTQDLPLLIPVHAELALTESGIDPRDEDAAGFAERYARRVQQGRTWVLIENDELLFKADVIAETPETTYIEGVWVNPETLQQDYGRRCMSQLARMLLWRTKSISLFVNDENEAAQEFYKQSGYHTRTVFDTIYLK
ncbi:MAG TPA: GNAT family N-acetyltransferase [Pyrinomonadaceae bacterium]|jgi:ribosomal protein S18 acetylase RimI-like enzyme|nr:GNAT family N-acetyltransferase [Pyrinomonadaceae bacterium]